MAKKVVSISKFSDIDTKELFRRYEETRDLEVRNELVQRHLYITEILSKKYINKGIDLEDIQQVASLGLIYAIERFEVNRGFEFTSFATPTIIGEIKKYFRDKGWSVRVPRRVQELTKRVSNSRQELQMKLQRIPTIQDIAEHLEVTPEEVVEAIEASQVYSPRSLDQKFDGVGDEAEVQLQDIVGQEDASFLEIENKDFIAMCLSRLDEIEVKIIKERYFEEKTQIQVAEELGVSQMTVSRMEKKIFKKFRSELAKYNSI